MAEPTEATRLRQHKKEIWRTDGDIIRRYEKLHRSQMYLCVRMNGLTRPVMFFEKRFDRRYSG